MSKKSVSFLIFILLFVGIIAEIIFLFVISKNKPLTTSSTKAQPPSVATAISKSLSLGNILLPLPGKIGGLTITGALKNIYEKDNKVFADIVFEDSVGVIHENKSIVLIPSQEGSFALQKQSTTDITPLEGAITHQTISYSNALSTLAQYRNKIFSWDFNTNIPVITSLPPNIRQSVQKIIPYFECNQMFLTNLQANTFAFPHCDLYAGSGGVYVENTK